MDYVVHLIALLAIFGMLATAANIDAGFAGVTSFAYAALFGLGAYVAGFIVATAHLDLAIAFGAAITSTTIGGWALSLLANRMTSDAFAIASLALAALFGTWILNAEWTGGSLGLSIQGAMTLFGIQIAGSTFSMLFALALLVLVVTALLAIDRSSFGQRLRVIREDPTLAQANGIDVNRARGQALLVSGAFAGAAGTAFALHMRFIHPDSFTTNDTILILSMAIVGGLGSRMGALVGAAILLAIPEALRFVGLPSELEGPSRQIIFGLTLAAFALLRPQGLLGRFAIGRAGKEATR